MILKNVKIYSDGALHEGAVLISDKVIKSIIFNPTDENLESLVEQNEGGKEVDCEHKILVPGIIDIHAHLRDMGQSEKETFLTGTRAAAFSGITTIFDMPNTKPPAITAEQVKNWMEKAQDNIHVNVGFIAGVPEGIDYGEIIKIIELGIIGFKIYPLSSLNDVDWQDSLKIQKLLHISSKFQIPIFIHPDRPISNDEKDEILEDYAMNPSGTLELHDKLYPCKKEAEYVNFILENYYKILADNDLNSENYPIVHFCHISCKESYLLIRKALKLYNRLKITFEITPHHLLLSKEIKLTNENFGKVLPPLRDMEHSQYLYKELKDGKIDLIGTDHAPHTMEEKSRDYINAPSGFPGLETYPLLLLDKVCRFEISLEEFVKVASENPARIFNLKTKGHIKEGYDADLIVIDRVPEHLINPKHFKSKAKFSPYENLMTSVHIWKVFLGGSEVNIDDLKPIGNLIKRSI